MPARGFSPPPETGSTSVKKKAAASGDSAAPARAASSACLSPEADTKARQTAPNRRSPRRGDGLWGGRGVVAEGEGLGPFLFFPRAQPQGRALVGQFVGQEAAGGVDTQR